jgi:signal transduction histidine kinase
LLLSVQQAMRQVQLLEEKRELARRAHLAEKMATIGTMSAHLSHEIRNPLNAAKLQLTVLERRMARLPEDARASLQEPLALVQGEIERLNRILTDFLQMARPQAPGTAAVDLQAVAERVLDLLEPQAMAAGVRLERRFETIPRISGDLGRLQQALMNLVLNAIQATPKGGWVRIELARQPKHAIAIVEDSGPGIPLDAQRKIFEPFFTTKEGGSGLGLPLVHSIIEQHGGSIALDSADGGARFMIRLPLFD